PPVHLDRAYRAGDLLDVTGQVSQLRTYPIVCHPGRGGTCGDLTLGIVCHGGLAEPDRGTVPLRAADHVREQPGRPLDADDQDAGGHRVERAAVADPPGVREAPHPRDHVVGRHPGRLGPDDEPARPSRSFPHNCQPPRPRPGTSPSLHKRWSVRTRVTAWVCTRVASCPGPTTTSPGRWVRSAGPSTAAGRRAPARGCLWRSVPDLV